MKFSPVVTFIALTLSIFSLSMSLSKTSYAETQKVSFLLYSCNLSFQASGEAFKIGIGPTRLNGDGTITCYDFLTGVTEKIKLKVKISGGGVGLEFSKISIAGGALGIGLTTSPESLLGRYGAIRAGGAVGVGIGSSAAIRLSKGAVTLNASIQGQTGLGVGIDLVSVDLEAVGEKEFEGKAQAAANSVTVETAYVQENTPILFVDPSGRPIKVLYLKSAPAKAN